MHGISILISGCVDFCLGPVTSTPNTPPLLMKKKHSLDISCNKCPPVHNVSSLSTATKQLCLFSCRCCFFSYMRRPYSLIHVVSLDDPRLLNGMSSTVGNSKPTMGTDVRCSLCNCSLLFKFSL